MRARPVALHAPEIPPRLIDGLDAKLASAAGLARHAWLAGAEFADGSYGLLLAIINPASGAEAALAQAVSEAVIFSGLEQESLDVAFFSEGDPIAERLARVGLRIDLPVPEVPKPPRPSPDTPPRLR